MERSVLLIGAGSINGIVGWLGDRTMLILSSAQLAVSLSVS